MAKKGTVVIPVYNRPEFLYLTLEFIKKADGAKDYDYVFCLDHGFNRDNKSIIANFHFSKFIIERKKHKYNKNTKQSLNVLNGIIYASTNGGLVFLIEDDVFIGEDYFKWHEEIHSKENVFCSIGAKNFNNRAAPKGGAHEYYINRGIYQSIGVCYKAETIDKLIKPHFNELYFTNPHRYVKEIFPKSKIGSGMIEQDGLIHRISESGNLEIVFPCIPRCFHAGIYGKNRGIPQKGTLKEKIQFIRQTVFDINEMKKYVSNEFYLYDSEPINLTLKNTKKLCLVKNQ